MTFFQRTTLFSGILLLGFFFVIPVFSQQEKVPLTVNIDILGGEFQFGQEVTLVASDPSAKIFWTFFPSGSPAAGHVETGSAKIQVRRSVTLQFFAFRSYADQTAIYTVEFEIESPEENEFLRIIQLDPNPNPQKKVPTITLQNLSAYASDLSGWKLASDRGEFMLPERELASGETLNMILLMKNWEGVVQLMSPHGVVKDQVIYGATPQGQVWQREVFLERKQVSELFFLAKRRI